MLDKLDIRLRQEYVFLTKLCDDRLTKPFKNSSRDVRRRYFIAFVTMLLYRDKYNNNGIDCNKCTGYPKIKRTILSNMNKISDGISIILNENFENPFYKKKLNITTSNLVNDPVTCNG
ncbi:hypothetical protein V1478_012322 [Vespula squamosa]|uniref:Uncharacterized protein n=1 Tax=Vespula squamosa TaxID=30214 RepID=A0ABD2ADG4_VESSQ